MNAPSLVDPDHYIGTITYVGASLVQANLMTTISFVSPSRTFGSSTILARYC